MSGLEKVLTLHPLGKKGVNIRKDKYDKIRDFIVSTLKTQGEITYQELNERAVHELSDNFDGKVAWYLVTVKLDLEARNVIERIPKTSPHRVRLSR